MRGDVIRRADEPCWCGSAEVQPVGVLPIPGDFAMHECLGCGALHVVPQPTPEQLGGFYEESYYGGSPHKFIGPVARLVSLFQGGRARRLSRHLSPPARVLDVGCGNGAFLVRLQQRGFEVEGTELTRFAVERVPPESGIPVHVGDLRELDLPSDHYDAVTMWHVLEHVRDPRATCEAVARVLRPGGYFLMALPNVASWQASLFGMHWFHHDPPRHLFGLNPRSLSLLLSRHGFDLLRLDTFSLDHDSYGWVQSVLNALGFRRDHAYDTLKGLDEASSWRRVVDLTSVAILAGPAVAIAAIESLLGRGGTMTATARLATERR